MKGHRDISSKHQNTNKAQLQHKESPQNSQGQICFQRGTWRICVSTHLHFAADELNDIWCE